MREVDMTALCMLDATQHQLALHILPVHHTAGQAAALLSHCLVYLNIFGHKSVGTVFLCNKLCMYFIKLCICLSVGLLWPGLARCDII